MGHIKSLAIVIGTGCTIGACSFSTDAWWPLLTNEFSADALWPSLHGKKLSDKSDKMDQSTTRTRSAPELGTSNFAPSRVTPGQSTGTFVGQRLNKLRIKLSRFQARVLKHNGNLQNVRAQAIRNSNRYQGTIAAINARLQVSTAPGNPRLIHQLNDARTVFAKINKDVDQLNLLANQVTETSTLLANLLETTRTAYGLTGAVDEDHSQLGILEYEVTRAVIMINRLHKELSEDVSRQTNYFRYEQQNLTALSLAIKSGAVLGKDFANRTCSTSVPAISASPAPGPTPRSSVLRRPLVVIRFDRPKVEYAEELYFAVNRALERLPSATFDLVAVAPNKGDATEMLVAVNASKRNAESVLRSLSDMGLPFDRVRLSAMISGRVAANEVHIYVR